MMKRTFLFLSIAILLFNSCDYITNPIEEGGIGPIDTTNTKRKVLIEDFTGHLCTNCPDAALIAEQLHDLYGDLLITVGVHAGPDFFVAPASPPNPDGSYSTDFRTPAGDAYAQSFGINSLPKGMVSRREFSGSITLGEGNWGSATSEIIGEDAIMKIEFEEVQYDQGNNSVSMDISIEALIELNGEYKCIVYLIENEIVDWQLWSNPPNPPDVPNYVHQHVLRANPNSTWGTTVFSGTVAVGTLENVVINNFNLNPSWNMDNSYLIAYVYDDSTSEIFQVEQIAVTP